MSLNRLLTTAIQLTFGIPTLWLVIEMIKEKVIRKLPKLNKVKFILGVFDKNNIFHRIMLKTVPAMKNQRCALLTISGALVSPLYDL